MNRKQLSIFLKTLDEKQLSFLLKQVQSEIKSKENARLQSKYSDLKIRGASLKDMNKDSKLAFQTLLEDDWSDLFISYDNKIRDCYVYFHVDPKTPKFHLFDHMFSKPFYVGMGKGNRAYNFKRSNIHEEKLRELKECGFTRNMIVYKFAKNMTEREARELESKLILYFGVVLFKRKGHSLSNMGRCLLNAKYEPMPELYLKLR